MSDAIVVWDDAYDFVGNASHIDQHGLTIAEVEEVLLDSSIKVASSRMTGRPCKFGWTSTGKHIIVVWEELNGDPEVIYPMTAYEVPPPIRHR